MVVAEVGRKRTGALAGGSGEEEGEETTASDQRGSATYPWDIGDDHSHGHVMRVAVTMCTAS